PDAGQHVHPAEGARAASRSGDQPVLAVLEPAAARWTAGRSAGGGGERALRGAGWRLHGGRECARAADVESPATARLDVSKHEVVSPGARVGVATAPVVVQALERIAQDFP